MANTLRFKRGLVSGIPTAALGEPLFTTDTFDLYIGNGTTNTRFQKYIASGATTQILRGDGSLYTFPLAISSPSAGQVLKYNGTSWVNDSDAGITGSGASGQVAYFTGATTQSGSNNLFWDNSLLRLGVGTNTPSSRLHVSGTLITQNFAGSPAVFFIGQYDATGNSSINNVANADLLFGTNNTQRARFTAGGNFIINNASTDNGLRFQVTGDGYFSGSVGIGTTALTGYTMRVQKVMTGSTVVWGMQNSGIIQSDVTNTAFYYSSQAATQATAFSVTNLVHYFANQSTIGAGSSVTNQYGFSVENTLTGATNNFGFYGNIASGTGRWNLYMNGTAANYLAGNTLIGATNILSSSFKLTATTSGSSSFIASAGFGNTNDSTGIFYMLKGRGTPTSPTALLTDDILGSLNFAGYISTSFTTAFTISAVAASNFTSLVNPVNLLFRKFDTSGNPTELMRLTSTNNLHIGTFSSDSGERLQVNGTMRVSGVSSHGNDINIFNTSTTGKIYINGGQTSARQYLIQNAITGITNAGIEIRDVTGGFTPFGIAASGAATFSSSVSATIGGFSNYITIGGTSGLNIYGTINVPTGERMFLNSYHGLELRTSGGVGSGTPITVFSVSSAGAATFSSSVTGASFIPSSSTIPTNGMYLEGVNTLGFATNSTSKFTINSNGHAALGSTLKSWGSVYKALQVGEGFSLLGSSGAANLYANAYATNTSLKYSTTGVAALYSLASGQHRWLIAPSGTADTDVNFNFAMTLNTTGNLLVGTTDDPGYRINTSGNQRWFAGNGGVTLRLENTDTIASLAENIGQIEFYGNDTASGVGARIQAVAATINGEQDLELSAGQNGNLISYATVRHNGAFRLSPQATTPVNPVAGDIYFDSGTSKLRCYDGTAWNDLF